MYLYGDSTASPLRSNFLEFLRDALDFSAFVLRADGEIAQGKRDIVKLQSAAGQEMGRLEALGELAMNAISQAPCGAGDSAASRCALNLKRLTDATIQDSMGGVRAQLARSIDEVNAREAAEREGCRKALERLLLPHDPWDALGDKQVVLTGDSPMAMSYSGRTVGASGCGWAWTIELAVAQNHPFSEPMRLERILQVLEISVPDMSGWLKKEVKVKPVRLERMVVSELFVDDDVVRTKLRVDPGAEAGYDLEVTAQGQVTMSRTGAKEVQLNGPFDVRAEDEPALVELAERLRQLMNDLTRKRLVEATFDDQPFETFSHLHEIVERLVTAMAPIVRDINDHSLTPTELVLKRLVGNDRREEIFVSKAQLREKYADLPEEMKRVFDPLALVPALPQNSVVHQSVVPMIPVQPAKPEPVAATSSAPPLPVRSSVSPFGALITKSPPPPAASQTVLRGGDSGAPSASTTANPDLVASIKRIVQLAKRGKAEDAFESYAELFSSEAFATYQPEHQRQTLKLLVLKSPATVSDAVRKAHRAAADRLRGLITLQSHAADYEMLGICQLLLEDQSSASATFVTGLELERNRDPQSELCGSLMRRVAAL
jgi:hypothetical protein